MALIKGNNNNNNLVGTAADDVIDGLAGADTMAGGLGNDTYIVDNINDKIIEYANQGIDTVQASVSYGLAVYLENLILTGSAAINATGNTQNNVLTGNSGNNILDGGLGADSMIGGLGHDLYIVDNSGDVVTEATNAGIDSVESSVNYALGSNVENIILTGTATTATGNSLDNFLAGNAANNTISGGAGADILIGGAGNDSLTGGAGDDTVIGDGVPFVGFIGSQINCGLGNTTGANGTADTVIFSGARTQYNVTLTEYNLPVIGVVKVFKITDSVTGRDGSDFVVGVENFKFADATYTQTTIFTPAVNVAPVISSNGAGASAAISIAENTSTVTTVTATDADSTTLSYSIAGGVDATKFSINAATGALSFVAAPNFEAPTDAGANNVYDVIVQVSDGANIDTQAIAVTVTNVNDVAPVINVSAAINVAENTSAVTTVTATDADSTTLIYSIAGGLDATKFSINAATGALSFVAAPNFEAPTDAGANNIYDVTVKVSDGLNESTQAIAVTVKDVNDNAPVITSNGGGVSAAITVAENTSAVTTVTATDADVNSTLTYSLTGADASLFSINAAGAISFVTAPNFEAPTDAGANNVYDLNVVVSDGVNASTQALTVKVTDVNDNAPVITSNGAGENAAIIVVENSTNVTTVTATDADAASTLSYILSGADADKFMISPTGVISFVTAPNFEAPTDVGGNNVYDVTLSVSDGVNTDSQALSISVTNINDVAPTINSNASINVAENTVAVIAITASDADSANLSYSIDGGLDADKFSIDALTGALSFINAPNFEAPTDVGANNIYNVIVKASDGTLSGTQALVITVTDVNDVAPTITSAASASLAENTTAVTTVTATDADSTLLSYSLTGADASLFSINAAGEISFITAPNFEAPTDIGANNSYDVIVKVSDGVNFSTQAIAITVTDVNDVAPTITSAASATIAENTSAVKTVTATDADSSSITYSLNGGADADKFIINTSTGELSFINAPNFEAPTDAGADNSYNVNVKASDGTLFSTQAMTITVQNVNEAPVIISNGGAAAANISVNENASSAVTSVLATDVDANTNLTYSLDAGLDAASFNINAATGALTFITPPDFEAPTDSALLNSYKVVVRAFDGALFSTQTLTINVQNVNEAPVITSNGGAATASISFAENSLAAVTTVAATDADANTTLAYSIAGGADAAKFSIDNITGLLSFIASPNFEAPTDVGGNNIYDVNVQVTDGALFDTQSLAITVTNVNEAPAITSNGGAATAVIDIAENTTAVTTVTSTDIDANTTLIYSLAGGADAAKFNINAATGALSFVAAPNFESPTDVVPTNSYQVIMQASDGALSDTQAFTVNVTNVDEAATGSLHIVGYAKPNATSASFTALNTIADPDTMSNVVQYQWQVNNPIFTSGVAVDVWTNIAGANSATFNTNLAGTFRVTSSYTDAFGNHAFASAETALVNVNNSENYFPASYGTAGDDYQVALDGALNLFYATPGNDTIVGGNPVSTTGFGSSYYHYFNSDASINLSTGIATSLDTGSDTLINIQDITGGSGNDFITGNSLNNDLHGNAGNDTLDGGAGNDSITGREGADVMTGGLGADNFFYITFGTTTLSGVGAGNRDIITDFKYGGADKIYLYIDANKDTPNFNDRFVFNATPGAAFTAAGQLHYHYEGAGANEITLIQGNQNANLAPDFEIELTGHVTLTAADFVF